MWSIYSIGDAAYMERVLNSVAMIVGTGEFTVMIRIGMLIGMLLVVLQGISQGGRSINIGSIFVSWMVFSTMYGPSTTVSIEDGYTGQVRVVANVPIGVAAIGGTISQIGYGMTDLFETAFSLPTVTRDGFASALETLKSVRKVTWDSIGYGYANDASKAGRYNVEQSWITYIMECTIRGIKSGWPTASGGVMSHASIQNADNLVAALEYANSEATTQITIDGNQTLPCTTAYNVLVQYTTGQFYTDLLKYSIAPALQMRSTDPAMDAVRAEDKVNTALSDLGFSDVSAKDYIIASTVEPLYNKAWAGEATVDQEYPYAITINDAIKQRNAQWEAESSLFNRVIRPMITFIEGFVYSVTPFMALIIVMGPFGTALAGRYLLLLFWIELWYPILAICNLYIMMTVQAKMAALAGAGTNITLISLAGLQGGDQLIQQYLSVGQMLASSTPGLALMLVYGSAVTATSFVGRMQGGDFVDEKKVAPDTMNSVARLTRQSLHQGNVAGGEVLSGARDLMPELTFVRTSGFDVSSGEREVHAKQEALSNAFAHNLSGYIGSAMNGTMGEHVSSSGTIGSGKSSNMLERKVHDIADSYKDVLGSGQNNTLALGQTVAANAALGGSFARVGGAIEQNTQHMSADEKRKVMEYAQAVHDSVANDHQWSASFQKQWKEDAAAGQDFTAQSGQTATDQRSFQYAASESVAAETTFSRAATSAVRSGEQWSLPMLTAVNQATSLSPLHDQLGKYVLDHGMRDDVQSMADRYGDYWRQRYGLNKEQQWTYAALLTTMGDNPSHAPLDEGERAAGQAFAGQLFGSNPDAHPLNLGNAGANRGVYDGAKDNTRFLAAREAEDHSLAPRTTDEVKQTADDRIKRINNKLGQGVDDASGSRLPSIETQQRTDRAKANEKVLQAQYEQATHALESIEKPQQGAGTQEGKTLKGAERKNAFAQYRSLALRHGLTHDQAEYYALKSVGPDELGHRDFQDAASQHERTLAGLANNIDDQAVLRALNTVATKTGYYSRQDEYYREPNLDIIGRYNKTKNALEDNRRTLDPEHPSLVKTRSADEDGRGHQSRTTPASPGNIALDKRNHEALIKFMIAEGGVDGLDGMKAVAFAALNRTAQSMTNTTGPTTLREVLEAPGQFEAVGRVGGTVGGLPKGTREQRNQAESIIADIAAGRIQDPTHGSTFFLNRDVATMRGTDFAAGHEGQVRAKIGHHTFLGPSTFKPQPEVPQYKLTLEGTDGSAGASRLNGPSPAAVPGEASGTPLVGRSAPVPPVTGGTDAGAPAGAPEPGPVAQPVARAASTADTTTPLAAVPANDQAQPRPVDTLSPQVPDGLPSRRGGTSTARIPETEHPPIRSTRAKPSPATSLNGRNG